MTQTGIEALIDDELAMDMVMSRVDWIIKLRDIFYNLLVLFKKKIIVGSIYSCLK